MKTKKILFSFAIVCFILTGCKDGTKKEVQAVNKQNVSLAISGMTCEIGCAKTIQSKLSKKEGVIDAKVIFTDSIANIEFDANKTSKKDLVAFVDGIAGGELYKASETNKSCKGKESKECASKKECSAECKKKCLAEGKDCASKKECKMADKKAKCKPDCKKECCASKNKKTASKENGKKACCSEKKAA